MDVLKVNESLAMKKNGGSPKQAWLCKNVNWSKGKRRNSTQSRLK